LVRAASHLIRLGFTFESEAVIRLCFEQVAWSNVVRNIAEPEEVTKLSGTDHVTKLKSLFPGAGPIYGRLRNLAHVAPSTRERFIVEQDGGVMIQIQAPLATGESRQLLLILMDAFLVGEECFEHVGLPRTNLDPLTRRLRDGRPALRLIDEFESVFPPGTKSFFDEWWR
jgi:hypothetical protein